MKVFGCTMQGGYCGGIILVAANDKEEAFLTAAKDENIGHLFDWTTEYGGWAQPFSQDAKVRSDFFPLNKWKEYKHLATDYKKPTVILAEYYAE